MAFHDLTTYKKPPKNLRSLLGLSLKFIPTPRVNTPWQHYETQTLPRFERSMRLKAFFATRHIGTSLIPDEDVIDHEDDITEDTDGYNKRMYIPSGWEPPPECRFPPPLQKRLDRFKKHLRRAVTKQRGRSNLLKHQQKALATLQSQTEFLIVQCDKNLGPAIIEREKYIGLVFRDHLNDLTTYVRVPQDQVEPMNDKIFALFDAWYKMASKKGKISPSEARFLEHHRLSNDSSINTFYVTMKVHKDRLSTRPIVSTSGTLLYALGVWCDDKLQIAAQRQRSYFKNTFDLKRELSALDLPPNALLFTSDAKSMYTNIPTNRALLKIGAYLRRERFHGVPVQVLMEGLRIIMKYNVFQFGDTTWRQKTGTAMGTPPAPPWATLYMAIFEDKIMDEFEDELILYRRFIDDIFGIFVLDPDKPSQFKSFCSRLNTCGSRLVWVTEDLSPQVVFMDLTITIKEQKIHTSLYEKPHNLHLYIPPKSCHPPGLLPGMVHGNIFRIFTLCTDAKDRTTRTREFLNQLQRRGWNLQILRPLFKKAITNAINYKGPKSYKRKKLQSDRSVLFHLRYHPKNPPSHELQRMWNRYVCKPPVPIKPLWHIRNYRFKKIEVDRMIISYSRPLNIGNLLSYRKLKDSTTGPPASSFCD